MEVWERNSALGKLFVLTENSCCGLKPKNDNTARRVEPHAYSQQGLARHKTFTIIITHLEK